MKINKIYFLLLFSILPLLSFHTTDKKITTTPQANNWMSFFGDNRPLHFISIPGTHDSGALHDGNTLGFTTYAKTQDYSIADQLNFGIRYLDIRCNYKDGEFKIYHGSVDQKQDFDDVLKTCRSFLAANPSETIIMSVKQEKSNITNNTYSQRFYQYTQAYPNLFYLGNKIPNLGKVRGKIVLVRRFISGDNFGINTYSNWPDNAIADVTNADKVNYYFQDVYKVQSNTTKFNQIKEVNDLSKKEQSMSRDNRKFYFNFTSGQLQGSSGNKIKNVSNVINPKILDYYAESENQNNYLGMVIVDFATANLARTIYMTNFNQ
ncbi:phosphatidylinositol-specific phospholipase C [Chryseobacterium sp. POL2]|uniref:phosphatidylinositol-specific phospholipase C n=1 Tax=Chryseobacterium sp. POL2 TaxID=2713414 RepID=UPI0013E19607|nr:phosphatidylinositol-specific phospholipase C [Chryseobacterium sp. POL2]QIG89575.1 phosphatidylinositol-specific phospholipase C [Chryseobacterium sp. POL2]